MRSSLTRPATVLLGAALTLILAASPAYPATDPTLGGRPVAAPQAVDEDDILLEARLRELVDPALRVAQDGAIQALVRAAVGRQVSGDTEALLSTIIAEAEQSSIVDPDAAQWQAFKAGVAQFQNINGWSYDPQIYIPNYDLGVPPAGNVVIAAAPADENTAAIPGYWLDAGGTLRTLDTPVDEAYVEAHEVWILSINDPLPDDVEPLPITSTSTGTGTGTGTVGPTADVGINAVCTPTGARPESRREYLQSFRVPNPGGLGELAEGKLEMRLMVFSTNGTMVRSVSFPKIKQRDIRNWQQFEVLITTWNRALWGDILAYQWFEYDSSGATTATLNIPYPGGVITPTVPWNRKNDNAGSAAVRFTDSTLTEYDTGWVRFRLCSQTDPNLACAGPTSASTTYPGYSPIRVSDCRADVRLGEPYSWANNSGTYPPSTPEWVRVDLGGRMSISRVVVYTSLGYPIRDYDIQVRRSVLFDPWTTVATVRGNTRLVVTSTFPADNWRYVRILGHSGPLHQPGYVRVNEIEVYAM